MKTILGLDLGTNSIGWAKVSVDDYGNYLHDIKLGSRIIPMSQDVLGNFDSGVTVSQTAQRTEFRSKRRLVQRNLQRRERLHRVLHVLDFLPAHYDAAIGWDRTEAVTYGKFLNHAEPKLAWEELGNGKRRFLFMDSFHEMVADFARCQPALVADGKKIPLDWTIYYLRKKALTQAITKEELAWILLNFNQKRGYYQLRGEEEENPTKKEGNVKRSFRAPNENDWGLRKKRTETLLEMSGKTVGAFIYDHLLQEPADKIRGNFIRTIERHYYKAELEAILAEQCKYHIELRDKEMLEACARELYLNNLPHQRSLMKKDMTYLLLYDLIFYQRPLKSKKALIANCPYEYYEYVDKIGRAHV